MAGEASQRDVRQEVTASFHTLAHLDVSRDDLTQVMEGDGDHATVLRARMRDILKNRGVVNPSIFVEANAIDPDMPEGQIPERVVNFYLALGGIGTSTIRLQKVEEEVFPHSH